jgi:hypothetical protein
MAHVLELKMSLRSSREPHLRATWPLGPGFHVYRRRSAYNLRNGSAFACDACKTRERCQSHLPFLSMHRDNHLCYEILTLSAVPLKLGLANSWLSKFLEQRVPRIPGAGCRVSVGPRCCRPAHWLHIVESEGPCTCLLHPARLTASIRMRIHKALT